MRILLVEDDELMARFVRAGLQEEGYAVDLATRGDEARELGLVNEYDLVLLDVMLPDTSGFAVAHALRGAGRTTPILMLTARTDTADVVKGLDAGADDYLTKPFQLDELKARVRALLRRGGAQRPDQLEFGGLHLDRVARQVLHRGQKLRLTPKEFALLQYLILNAEQTVTRTELLEKVWDMHFDPRSNVVDVHVTRLRQKLRRVQAGARIDTVRGSGFVLSVKEVGPENRDTAP